MAIDFPASPTNGQTYTVGSVTYTYDGTKWTAVTGSVMLDKIQEGNTSAEVIDTGSDGRFVVTTEGSERLRVDSSGRLGIGTTSPSGKLHVEATTASSIYATADSGYALLDAATNSSGARFNVSGGDGTNGVSLWGYNSTRTGYTPVNYGASQHLFKIGAAEAVRIDASSRLLVGTSSARDKFNNAASGQDPLVQFEAAGTAARELYMLSLTVNNNSASSNAGASLMLARSGGSTVGSYTAVTNGDSIGNIRFQGADGSELVEAASIQAFVDGTPGSNDMPGRLVFSTTADGASSPTERMRILSGGGVCIGATSFAGVGLSLASPETSGMYSRTTSTGSTNHLRFENPNGVVGSITTSASATAYNTSSDYRLKENVVPLTGAADRLNQLQVHRFNFIADPDTTVDGFIAHEAQAVVPECVTGAKDEVDADGNPVYQGIDQSKLVPLLTAALQDALAEISALKDRVAALEAS